MSDDVISRPCLCCNLAVSVSRGEWLAHETPAAFCLGCFGKTLTGTLPWAQVRMLYLLRCQVATLRTELDLANRDIKRLFTAQQDMEAALLKR